MANLLDLQKKKPNKKNQKKHGLLCLMPKNPIS